MSFALVVFPLLVVTLASSPLYLYCILGFLCGAFLRFFFFFLFIFWVGDGEKMRKWGRARDKFLSAHVCEVLF